MDLIHRLEEKFGGIQLPVGLFDSQELYDLSGEALFLYGLLYAAQYSIPDKDEAGRPCVHLIIPEIAEIFRCGREKARRIRTELIDSGAVTMSKTKDGVTYLYVQLAAQE